MRFQIVSKKQRDTFLLLIACLVLSLFSKAQTYGNEWIDFDQAYWTFTSANDEWIEIPFETIVQSGFPLSGDADRLQIYTRESQVPIEVVNNGADTFGAGDTLRLRSLKNDGWMDYLMYDDPANLANPHYSLFNDSIAYFLTEGAPENSLRIANLSTATFEEEEALEWIFGLDTIVLSDRYQFGFQDQYGISNPTYTEGEGFYGNLYAAGGSKQVDLDTRYPYYGENAPDAQVLSEVVGTTNAEGTPNHHLQILYSNDLVLTLDTTFSGFKQIRHAFNIPAENISNFTRVRVQSVNDLGVDLDGQAIGNTWIKYARQPHLGNVPRRTMQFPSFANLADTIHVELQGFSGSNAAIYVGYPALAKIIPEQEGAFLRFSIPANLASDQFFEVVASSQHSTLQTMSPAGTNGSFTDFTSLDVDSAFVLIAPEILMPSASEYATYRSFGGNVILAKAEELYQQYSGGVAKHPIAIRRFCDQLLSNPDAAPAHLFLVGKSIQNPSKAAISGTRQNPELFDACLLPTWGYPGSDLPFTAGLVGTLFEPAIPTGRIAAKNNEEVLDYLNKVVAHENNPQAAWMKNVLHFGGGGNIYEQNLFKYYLGLYKDMASDTCFGGDVHTFIKNTTDPIQFDLSQEIDELISGGASLMTFFGHASSTGFDQNIDSPENYDNQGRYPLLIGNSCYTGNIHLGNTPSTSELFVLAPNRGVIGFLAKGDLGVPSYLNLFTENFYRNQLQTHYGESIGQGMKRAVQDFQIDNQSYYAINTALTFALHGDPAVKLRLAPLPDYSITDSQVWFSPDPVTTALDSFQINIAIENIGKAVSDSLTVEVIRKKGNGAEESFFATFPSTRFKDTLRVSIPVDPLDGAGQNYFDVLLDQPANLIEEMDDFGNNVLSDIPLFIVSSSLIPIDPYPNAIYPHGDITLKASTGNAVLPFKNYLFEIDQDAGFSSPALQSAVVSAPGGVVEWELPFQLETGQVYFWRTAPQDDDTLLWSSSSFQYLPEKRGWSQADFGQWSDNRVNRLRVDTLSNSLTFFTGEVNLKCTVYGAAGNSFEALGTRFQLDLDVQDYSGCGNTPAIHVAVLDSATLEPWKTNYNGLYPENEFGNFLGCTNARSRPENYFIFRQNNADQLAGFVDMMANGVEDGHYLLVYSWRFANYDGWDANETGVYDAFVDLGAQQIGQAQDSVPFIFFMKKGFPETIQEIYGTELQSFIELNTALTGSYTSGSIDAPLFGPALAWEDAEWSWESDAGDAILTRIHSPSGGQYFPQTADQATLPIDQLGLNATSDPYLSFDSRLSDTLQLDPAQLDFWRMYGTPAPEFALQPSLGYTWNGDTLQQGETGRFAVAIENVSEIDGDSLLINYWLENPQRERTALDTKRLGPLLAGAVLADSISFNTQSLRGNYTFWMEVNPTVSGEKDQAEQFYFNNYLAQSLHVIGDDANPLLDVTFDGKHILDGEIVSSQPDIEIDLRDNNPFILLNSDADTSLFQIYLKYPSGEELPIYFSNNDPSYDLFWTPSSAVDQNFEINFQPRLEQDGQYRLRVRAEDKQGNSSGSNDYLINFEIINEAAITQVMNYPNPFTTRTQFVFTLTGSSVPDDIMIQIMTVRGTVVKEIFADDLGPLRIGKNITSYAWDGKDNFGDQLAPGLYLYVVKAKLNGEDLKLRQSGADAFFKNGMGKMYLLK